MAICSTNNVELKFNGFAIDFRFVMATFRYSEIKVLLKINGDKSRENKDKIAEKLVVGDAILPKLF